MSLNSYITHPTGAGPGGLQPHTGDSPDRVPNQLACEIFSGNITYHSYYQIRNGHCDCFTITILKKRGFTHYLHLSWLLDFLVT